VCASAPARCSCAVRVAPSEAEGPDGDPIDAAIWWDVATHPGVVIPCRALAVVRVEQNPGDSPGRLRNDRVVALAVAARRERALSGRVRQELEQFFIAATVLEDKDARILLWDDGAAAVELIESSAR
jgi:inorganic pyrophosphatase